MFVVELELLCRRRGSTCVVAIAGDVGKLLGANSGAIKWVSMSSLLGKENKADAVLA